MADGYQSRIGAVAEQATSTIGHAKDQVLGAIQAHAEHLTSSLQTEAGSWVERILHEANKVLSHVPGVGLVTGASEALVHELNKK
jgi:hypothetical protein